MRRPRRIPPSIAATFTGLAAVFTWQTFGPRSLGLLAVPNATDSASSETSTAKAELSACEQLRDDQLKSASLKIERWEKVANEGRSVLNYGRQASRLFNQTLAAFDSSVSAHQSSVDACAAEREVLAKELQRELHSIFLVQSSSIEQVLYQRLKKDLLRKMRRKKRELTVKEKLRFLHASMKEYDSQVKNLIPFFVSNSEHDRAEKRLSELQWGIADTPEGKEMQQRWKMERLRRMPMRNSRGLSVSLSPGIRLMFRPPGFGNFQIYSRRQVGPMHNPNEVAIAMFNDGNVMDVYNKKPKPPLLKFQPTVGIDVSAG